MLVALVATTEAALEPEAGLDSTTANDVVSLPEKGAALTFHAGMRVGWKR